MSLFSPLWQPAETTAASIPVDPTGTISATTVQDALAELDDEKVALVNSDYVAAKYFTAINFGAFI